MILTLLIWAYQALLCSIAGFMVLRAAGPGDDGESPVSLSAAVFTGLAVIGTISSLLSVFINISLASNIAVWVICAVYMYIDRSFLMKVLVKNLSLIKSARPVILISSSVTVLIILAETSLYLPKNYDTALYHAQAIRWIESFPAVPGLGNLHMRFAYDSGWFPLSAFFSFKYLSGVSFHCLNGFILAVSSLYFIGGAGSAFTGDSKLSSWLKLLLLPFSIIMYLNFSSSPGTDTPAAVFIWVISVLFLEYIENGKKNAVLPLIIMCAFALTVKLAAIPIAIISLYIIIKTYIEGGKKTSLFYCLAFIAIMLPWFIRNYITSGYIVYPLSFTGFIPSDWKMPAGILTEDTDGIRKWSFAKPHGMAVLKYLFEWIISLRPAYKAVFFPAAAAGIFSAVYLVFYYIKKCKSLAGILLNPALIALYSAAAGVIFVFLSAPDFRYGASFFLLPPLFICAKALSIYFREKTATASIMAFLILLCAAVPVYEIFLYNRYFYMPRDIPIHIQEKPGAIAGRLVMPAPYYDNESGRIPHNAIPGLIIYTHADRDWWCWYDPFPCVPNIRNGLYMRARSPAEGFAISNSQ
ncbi:MAG: hypothetical protein ABSG94_01295 [Brevinematales bacterium]|jgi:hypothetical protein